MSSKGLQNEHFAGSSIKLTDSLRKTIVPATGALPTNSEMVKPRITLRFASSYYFMGYICWGIVLARLFGFSWMFIVLLTILIVLFSIIFHIDSPPKRFKNDWDYNVVETAGEDWGIRYLKRLLFMFLVYKCHDLIKKTTIDELLMVKWKKKNTENTRTKLAH